MPEFRNSLTHIGEILIDTPDGSQVPLKEVADVRISPAATVIDRDAVSRYIDVGANVTGRGFNAVRADVENSLQAVELPFEYHLEVISDSFGLQVSQQRLILIALASLVGIYLIMQAALDSWRLAFIIFLTMPIALAGSLVAAIIGGGELSIGALFGLLTIAALTARSGLTMVNHFQHLAQEDESFGSELVLRGAQDRLAPILMTALATGLAFLPMLFGGQIPGNEMLSPMAGVMLGGLITTTLITLFVIPPLYLRYGYKRAPEQSSPIVEEGAPA
jgi:Cu/Ag efflux pump CusA